jgi:hypothetical protein
VIPNRSDLAPTDPALTRYDKGHLVTYLRILDADADGADWREVSRIVLHIDAEREPDRRGMRVIVIQDCRARRSPSTSGYGLSMLETVPIYLE